ncbi:MAG: hypothetical protein WC456_03990 [Patescibacteria group bacterium]
MQKTNINTDNYRRLDAKLDDFGKTSELLKKTEIIKADIGKIFYSNPGKTTGSVISNEKFLLMDPDTIGGWIRIGELDVNTAQTKHSVHYDYCAEVTKFPKNLTIAEIIADLIYINEPHEATELLFGCDIGQLDDETGRNIFTSFARGEDNSLLKEAADHHVWVKDPSGLKGFAIEVYPGEWLLFQNETGSKVLMMIS